MSRYIDADALHKAYIELRNFKQDTQTGDWISLRAVPLTTVIRILNDAPSIDIEPKRGEWRTTETLAVCSECGTLFEKSHLFGMHFANYCPYCGARMFAKDKWQTEREGE